jgi:hypothetical protein
MIYMLYVIVNIIQKGTDAINVLTFTMTSHGGKERSTLPSLARPAAATIMLQAVYTMLHWIHSLTAMIMVEVACALVVITTQLVSIVNCVWMDFIVLLVTKLQMQILVLVVIVVHLVQLASFV